MKHLLQIICVCCSLTALGQEITEDSVTFTNGDVTLAGTLSLPSGEGPFPGVLLISGSGPQNRDSEIFGFKPFKLLADHLNSKGIAVLRYDDRGTGASGGTSPMMVTSEVLAEDAAAGVEYLRNDKRIADIGVLGHSEGGILAPILAADDKDIDFVILMAGYGVPGREVIRVQQKAIMQAQGMDSTFIALSQRTNERIISLMDSELAENELKDSVKTILLHMVDEMPESMSSSIGDRQAFAETQSANVMQQFASPWMHYFLTYDPAPVLARVSCPVLLLFGDKDMQVLAKQNAAIMAKALSDAGNGNIQVNLYPDANHLFQKATTGSPMEYGSLEKLFVPNFLSDITKWIKEQTNE